MIGDGVGGFAGIDVRAVTDMDVCNAHEQAIGAFTRIDV
jgi:hypothetical protein